MQDDTKHTPGPLTIAAGLYGDFAILDKDNRIIGEAYYKVGPDEYKPAKHNARLWAAAPDLLAACEAFVNAAEVWFCNTPEVNAAYQAAHAAIAKAKGDQ
jgi:hypothetical protein